MKLKLKAKTLKDVLSGVAILVDEAVFNIAPDSVTLKAMDPSHVAMVILTWKREAFDEYVADGTETKLCVNTANLMKLLKRVTGEETATLNSSKGELSIVLESDYVRRFTIPTLVDVLEEEIPSPQIKSTSRIVLESSTLKNIIEDCTSISDHIILEAVADKFTAKAKGDLGEASAELTKESKKLLTIEVEKESKSIYALSYLTDIVKEATPLSDTVIIEFSTDLPLKLTYEQSGRQIIYYLAPRVG